jgi:hypothetical protein
LVVERSRLWKSEKADVAHELIGHFAEGLSRGENAEALEASFGAPRRAARLIRRAKRRQRPFIWKAWVRSLQVLGTLLAVIVAIYVAATIRLISGKPVAPADRHDYLADITAASRAVPDADRAWTVYRQAIEALGEMPTALTETPGEPRPGDPVWPEIATFLEANGEALELARQAAARPGFGYVVGFEIDEADVSVWPHLAPDANSTAAGATLWSILMPHLAELRKLSILLVLDAHRAASLGDGAVAAANIEAILGTARHARETPLIGSDLTSLSQVGKAVAAVGEILAQQPEIFTDRQLLDFAHRLAALQGDQLGVRLGAEVLAFQDLMQRLYTDDGEGDGRLTADGLAALSGVGGAVGPLAPVAGLVIAGRKEMTNEFNRWLSAAEAEMAKPLWRQDAAKLDRELERLQGSLFYRNRYWPVVTMMPAMTGVGRLPELVAQERDAVSVAIALELYRRRAGNWPASLDALVPDLLPAVPPDRYDGKPLRYQLVDGKPLVYSIGSDRDDDAGRAPRNAAGREVSHRARMASVEGEPPADGDWVLWTSTPPAPPDMEAPHRAEQDAPFTGS